MLGEAGEDKAAWEPEAAEVIEPDVAEVVAKVAVSYALFSCIDWGTWNSASSLEISSAKLNPGRRSFAEALRAALAVST